MIDFQVEEPVCVGQSAKWFDGRRHAIHQETNVAHVCPALHPQPFDVGVCPLDSDRDVHGGERTGCSGPNQQRQGAAACAAAAGTAKRMVREVFMIHVGGTRCATSSTANIMKIQARITLTVEFIRGYIFIFLFYV